MDKKSDKVYFDVEDEFDEQESGFSYRSKRFNSKSRNDKSKKQQHWYSLIFLVILTTILCIYFRCPSTLYVYLIWIICLVPLDILLLSKDFIKSRFFSDSYQYINLHIHDPKHSNSQTHKSFSILKRLRYTILSLGISIWIWVLIGLLFNGGDINTNTAINDHQINQSSLENPEIGKTFIAINLYNSADLFPKFGNNLIELIELIGGSNKTFISIYESNSIDKTKDFLDLFSKQLRDNEIQHSVVSGGQKREKHIINEEEDGSDVEHILSNSNHIGIDGDGQSRIQFLANVRNEAMRPFYEQKAQLEQNPSTQFDKILWLNDIIFDPLEIKKLLQTNKGLYDATCAFDFMPLGLYDTWVTRDIDGKRAKPLWPYFATERDVNTLLENKPILVDSCWNGAIAFDSRWFIESNPPQTKPNPNKNNSIPTLKKYASNEDQVSLPLRFRQSSTCLSSECLLISLDIHHALQRLNKRPVILMNPNVITAYDYPTFFIYHNLMRWKIVQPWRLIWERFISGFAFQRLTDLGRKPSQCFEAFQSFWSKPHPLSDSAFSNTEILEDVVKKRWQ